MRSRKVRVDGVAVHVVEAGDPAAPPVVFLHGWPQSWVEWREVMALATAEYHAIAIDLPGIGESAPSVTDGSKRELAVVVHHLAEQLELERPMIVGHDAGGMIAYAYLRTYQDLAAAVIVDVVIPGLDPWEEVIRNPYLWHFALHATPALPELLVQGHQSRYLDYFFDSLAVDPARIGPEARAAYADAYASDAALTAGFDLYRAFAQDARDNAAGADAPTVTPCLYLRGAASRGRLDSYLRGFQAAGVRDVSGQLVADSGHFIADEQPAALWRAIREFMAPTRATPG
jgi:pimeloyl-ACP methyl ester carboxylesterase